jgi:hypothetical protein
VTGADLHTFAVVGEPERIGAEIRRLSDRRDAGGPT